MSALLSILCQPSVATLGIAYTTPALVSAKTGGAFAPEEIPQEWIDWAQAEVDRRTGIAWRSENFSDEIDGNGLDTIFTRGYPILEIFFVQVDGRVLDPSVYAVNPRTGSIRLKKTHITRHAGRGLGPVFHQGEGNVIVSGIRGYRRAPPLVQKITTLLAAKTALENKFGPLVDSESIGDFSQTRSFKKLNDELDRAWEALGRSFPMDLI